MNAYRKFATASEIAGDNGAMVEININGVQLFIPMKDFDPNDGFQVRLWTAQKGECAIGYDLAGSASNKDIVKLYREQMPKPFVHNSETKV